MPQSHHTVTLAGEGETLACGARLASALSGAGTPLVIYLSGELGAGKTTFVRGVLRALGFIGTIRSPTFTLLETYALAGLTVIHADLYRLRAPEEIEALALPELLTPGSVLLVEWPERGEGWLPAPDLDVTLRYEGEGRSLSVAARRPSATRLIQEWFR